MPVGIPIGTGDTIYVLPLTCCETNVPKATDSDIYDFGYLIKPLKKFILKHNLYGISLPQIGVNTRICGIRNFWQTRSESEVLFLINPSYGPIEKHSIKVLCRETCLGSPSRSLLVERNKYCTLHYTDLWTNKREKRYLGPSLLSVQHVIDHTNGSLESMLITEGNTGKEDRMKEEFK
jgi:peptide deformylase